MTQEHQRRGTEDAGCGLRLPGNFASKGEQRNAHPCWRAVGSRERQYLRGEILWTSGEDPVAQGREGEPRGPGMEAAGRPGLGRGQRQRPGCGAGWEVLGAPRDHGQDLCVGFLPTSQAQGLCGRGQWPLRSSPGPAHLPAPSPGSWRGSGPRAPYVAGSSAEASASGFGAFMWSGPLRTAGWKLVFHQNSQGLVSCLTHNWWFFLKC